MLTWLAQRYSPRLSEWVVVSRSSAGDRLRAVTGGPPRDMT